VIYRQKTEEEETKAFLKFKFSNIYHTKGFFSFNKLFKANSHRRWKLKKASTKIPFFFFVPFGNYKEGANGLLFYFFFA
jgi:hypothetical protein